MRSAWFVLCAIALPTIATASELKLYDPVEAVRRNAEADSKVRKLQTACAVGAMLRMGPSPAQATRCEAAEKDVLALGVAGARAALAQLDAPSMQGTSRLYDVIGRSAELAFVGPLVHALEREAAAPTGNDRHWEVQTIARTLTQLTYAAPKGTPAIAWRTWADAHHGVSRATLVQERMTEVEASLAAPDVGGRIEAALFLMERAETRERGREVLTEIYRRTDLSRDQKRAVESELRPAPSGGAKRNRAPSKLEDMLDPLSRWTPRSGDRSI